MLDSLVKTPWGETYRARQVSLDRVVSLTVLTANEAVHARARVCAGLTHPNLVSGIDFGEVSERRYLVTEWVEGASIGDIVHRSGPIAAERCLEITLAVTRALEHAADQGLVHGAITPDAVLIARGGTTKLMGFGSDRQKTRVKLDWRSPEQKRGERPDARSDVYSLGTVLYLMLSGRHPFEDAPPAEIVDGEVVERPYPLEQANRRLGPETVAFVGRMMAESPDERFAAPGELAEALESLVQELEQRVTFRPKRGARPGIRRTRGVRSRRRRRR